MKFNKITVALCCAATMSTYVGAASLETDNQQFNDTRIASANEMAFADWMAEQKAEKFADTTDQIIVKMNSGSDAIALKMGSETSVVFNKSSLSSAKGDMSQAVRGQQIMMDFNLKAGMPLSFVKTHQTDSVILKLPKEMHVDDVDFITEKLAASAYAGRAEKNPKRWPLAENKPWGLAKVEANQLSDSAAGNLTVCVIDSGYDNSHPDLPNATGTNNSGTGNWYVPGGSHGTHVAGTIAALNNNQGVEGVLPNNRVNMHIIKVFNESGWGYSSDLVDAVQRCENAGADVVNMSLGGPSSNNTERNAMANFEDDGMLLIAAAGNDGNSSLSYPASYDAVVAVGAIDENEQHAEFSQFTSQVELAAPGEAILSTVARGDGRQGYITFNGSTTGDDRVVPLSRFINQGGNFNIVNINGTATGALAACNRSGSSYSCGNMSGKICVVERNGNQGGGSYPDIDAAQACESAGAAGIVIYSNSARPGLQNPFLVDANNDIRVPTVSVNRALGQTLRNNAGRTATLETRGNTDYEYYNGTSMASPHVAGVAALAWSNNLSCTNVQVREALKETAKDIDSSGRDNRTGYGLVKAKAASDYLANGCNGGSSAGVTETINLPRTTSRNWRRYTVSIPSGASNFNVSISGGSGDADLYVRKGSRPSTSSYDCRPYENGNNESCSFNSSVPGTWHIGVRAYSTYNNVTLTYSYD